MLKLLITLDSDARGSLQSQLREKLSEAIARGDFEDGVPLPSTRELATQLGISRNTVSIVYQELVSEEILFSRGRRGYFISPNAAGRLPTRMSQRRETSGVDWDEKLVITPSSFRTYSMPTDWRSKKYTFAYGQHDRWIFPISSWRKCSRESLSLHDMHDWTVDYVDADDPLLLEAFRRRVLPRRGFTADTSQLLVTVGAQHALQLTAQCLVKPGTVVGIEDPSYPDARSIFRLCGAELRPIPVDDEGLIVSDALNGCDVVYVTPNRQSPTTVKMSDRRREALLRKASEQDFIIVEDDYETETDFGETPSAALKSRDIEGRVIYLTSLSKLLSPGLRLGFLVGPSAFLREARTLQRLSIRHPAANNQRTLALFLQGGHYEALIRRFHQEYEARWRSLRASLRAYIPEAKISPCEGGSSIWVAMPEWMDTMALAQRAYAVDVHVEPGAPQFLRENPPRNFLRLGISSIKTEDIPEGIRILSGVAKQMAAERE